MGLKTTGPSSEPIKARQAYFMALRKHWPELLDSLRENVLPKYRPRWLPFTAGVAIGDAERDAALSHLNAKDGMFGFESWDALQNDSERTELLKSLEEWGARFRITEAWIFQAALDTLQGYSDYPDTPMGYARPKGSERQWFWLYAPRTPPPAFQPQLARGESIWFPQEDWKTFRKRLMVRFAAQLEDYRHAVELRVKAQANLTRDAEWTARYQKGGQAFEIAVGVRRYRDVEQAVYRAVERFASAIGLNLRKIRRRRYSE